MSGIFGILDSKNCLPLPGLIAQMGQSMAHHDRYQIEIWVDETGGAALGRIGIGVFNQETQPGRNQAGSVVIFLAGELYNQPELRRELERSGWPPGQSNDLDLILRLYELYGDACIESLEGAFVLAIWDRARLALTLANDRFGLYPTYYSHEHGVFSFAPEVNALLSQPNFARELDLTALAEYMRFQCLLGDKTFFKQVKLLPNATIAKYSLLDDRLDLRTYWDFSCLPQTPGSIRFEEALEESTRLFRAGVERLSGGEYQLGVLLSGGLDSRAILGMIPAERWPVDTFTYGLEESIDLYYASQIARLAGSRHHSLSWQSGNWVKTYAAQHLEMTEGFHSWIHAHGINCLDEIRQTINLNLTGLGGDFSVISWNDPVLLQASDDVTFLERMYQNLNQRATWPSIDDGEEALLYSARTRWSLVGRAFESLQQELKAFEHLPHLQRAEYFALVNTDRRMFQYYTVFKRSAIELRFPFYDYHYLEFMYSLPPELRANRRLRKAMILRTMPKLAQVGNAYDRDPITENPFRYLFERTKAWGRRKINRHYRRIFLEYNNLYADYENWLRGELHDWAESILLGEKILKRDLFHPGYLHSIWTRMNSGLEQNIIGKLAPIMTYEMLLERFYDPPGKMDIHSLPLDHESTIEA